MWVSVSAPSLGGSVRCTLVAAGHLDELLAPATLRVVQAAVPIQATDSASVTASVSDRSVHEGGSVLVVSLDAVVMSMLVRPPRALLRMELLTLRQMASWQLWVEVFWHLLTGIVLSMLFMSARV